MITVVRLAPGDQWDQTLVEDLLSGDLWPHGLEFEFADPWPDADGIVLLVPGRYWHDRTAELTDALARYNWVLAIRTGDEEDLLDIEAVKHPNIRWWVQTPRTDREYGDARFLPLGYSPHFRALPADPPSKHLGLFLAAQCTHDRRRQAFDALYDSGRDMLGHVEATEGFTHGMPTAEYVRLMCAAKVAPAPSGAVSPDSFRLWEALQAHAIPVADDISPAYPSQGFWRMLLDGTPFPVLEDYSDLPGWIDDQLAAWPANANRAAAWWMALKRRIAHELQDDLAVLGAEMAVTSSITVLVSTSPIPSHPDTAIIDETIASVRAQLPDAEIILMCDGVRAEQEDRRADYEEYLRRILWSADHVWGNVLPLVFDEHLHQAVCTKQALEHVRTPLLLFVEADTPLTDGYIPWGALGEAIRHGDANVVRLHHEASILDVHRYLMLDRRPVNVRDALMMRTIQWSNRPHLASTAWYRDLLDRYFPNDERNFIEDVVYSKLIGSYERDGSMGWQASWRTWIYTPEGDIKRSYHTDGRAGEDKFDG